MMAGACLSILPLLIVYIFANKSFMQVTLGACERIGVSTIMETVLRVIPLCYTHFNSQRMGQAVFKERAPMIFNFYKMSLKKRIQTCCTFFSLSCASV